MSLQVKVIISDGSSTGDDDGSSSWSSDASSSTCTVSVSSAGYQMAVSIVGVIFIVSGAAMAMKKKDREVGVLHSDKEESLLEDQRIEMRHWGATVV